MEGPNLTSLFGPTDASETEASTGSLFLLFWLLFFIIVKFCLLFLLLLAPSSATHLFHLFPQRMCKVASVPRLEEGEEQGQEVEIKSREVAEPSLDDQLAP